MHAELENLILDLTQASAIAGVDTVQSLWSGYGEIIQVALDGSDRAGVMIKQVALPEQSHHPRGWDTDIGHKRKVRSYQVEWHWYAHYAALCGELYRVPEHIYSSQDDQHQLLIMEDLSQEFPVLIDEAELPQIKTVLRWLAHFHARFLFHSGEGLWPIGTYWHLQTRQEEFERMTNRALKNAAGQLDLTLNSAHFQTLVHGDAKLANFCFNEAGDSVAAVDFQYVGRGCGIKDVVYLFTSALNDEQLEIFETELLNYYFCELKEALAMHGMVIDFTALEAEWRLLYPIAWADFHRFLDGWSPNHWKINRFMNAKTERVLTDLLQGKG